MRKRYPLSWSRNNADHPAFRIQPPSIYLSYDSRTLETILWTLGTGLCIAIAYIFLWAGVPSRESSGRAVTFGILIYGLPIAFVNFFVVLALKIDVTDLALRSTMDTLAVIIGIYLTERSLFLEDRSKKHIRSKTFR